MALYYDVLPVLEGLIKQVLTKSAASKVILEINGQKVLSVAAKEPTRVKKLGLLTLPVVEKGSDVRFVVSKTDASSTAPFLIVLRCLITQPILSLPNVEWAGEVAQVGEKVAQIFEKTLLKRSPDDTWETQGRPLFKEKVVEFAKEKKAILFFIPGFPFKSKKDNSTTIGTTPDMAEKLALENLEKFLDNIRAVYPPGAKLVIFSDGRVYSDIFRKTEAEVIIFRNELRKLTSCKDIMWADFGTFFGKEATGEEARSHLEAGFGTIEPGDVERRLKTDRDFAKLLEGFRGFVEREVELETETELDVVVSRLLARNDAYTRFLAIFFPDHVRLTIHLTTNVHKFSINLVGESEWLTPWHACALRHPDGRWSLARRPEAEEMGGRLVPNELLPYFQL